MLHIGLEIQDKRFEEQNIDGERKMWSLDQRYDRGARQCTQHTVHHDRGGGHRIQQCKTNVRDIGIKCV